MSARTDELERLQRLRDNGTLTEAEFQAEKRRVLGDEPALRSAPLPPADIPEPDEADAGTEERRKRNILYAVIGLVGLAIAIAVGIWLGRGVSGGESAPEANVSLPQAPAETEDNMIVAAPPTNVRALPMPEQLSRAFAAAFGTAGAASVQVGGRTINYRPGQLIWAGERAMLLSPGIAADDCHACSGSLAVHYLAAAGDGFRVTGAWPDAVPGEGFGAPPKYRLTSQFTTAPAIYEEGGYTGQGCTSGGVTITELAPGGPIRSGPIRTIYSMEGPVLDAESPGGEIKGVIANVVKDVGFDVNYSGEQPFTEHWVRNGARFALDGAETRMPQC